jgi:hypothetical protein
MPAHPTLFLGAPLHDFWQISVFNYYLFAGTKLFSNPLLCNCSCLSVAALCLWCTMFNCWCRCSGTARKATGSGPHLSYMLSVTMGTANTQLAQILQGKGRLYRTQAWLRSLTTARHRIVHLPSQHT